MDPPATNIVRKGDYKRKLPSYIQPRDRSIDRRCRPCPKRQVNLERVIQETCEEELNGLDIDLTEDDDDENENNTTEDNKVAVYLRLRPHPRTDRTKYEVRDNSLVVLCEETVNQFKKEIAEKHFSFSKVFGDAVNQSEIYENCIRSSLNAATTDVGSTFLTYGTSGSGKTFTLLGDENEPGIVSRGIEHVFTQYGPFISEYPMVKIQRRLDEVAILTEIAAQNELNITRYITEQVDQEFTNYEGLHEIIQSQHLFEESSDPNIASINVWVSFVEIYNESVHDLLDLDANRKNLQIIGNEGESFIKNVQWVFAPTAQACHSILAYGQLRASYSSTAINNYSSRSHSVFYINVVTITKEHEVSYANYKFCDLAGSERIKKAETQGDRLKETQRINKSLMTLGRCLSAVHANQKANRVVDVVPVRDSKLTLLIQAALTGRERLTMIVNLLPLSEYFDENLNVLAFSSIAKQIHVRKAETRMAKRQSMRFSFSINALTSPTRTRVDHVECEMEKERLQDEMDHYKEELLVLKGEMFAQEVEIRNKVVDSYEELIKKRDNQYTQRLEATKEAIKRPYEARIDALKKKFEELEDDYEELSDKVEYLDERNKKVEDENVRLKMQLQKLMEERMIHLD